MLDGLPYELLDLNIRETCPLPALAHYYLDHHERRRRLIRYSLICRGMRAVAQAMLPEVFAPKKEGEEQVVLNGRVDGTAVRVLILADYVYTGVRREEILRACPNTRHLRLSREGAFAPRDEVCLSSLASLSNLVELSLHSNSFPSLDVPFLPHLVTLSLTWVYVPRETLDHLLDSSHTPSLRQLALSSNKEVDTNPTEHDLAPSFPADLLDRLDLLILSSQDPISIDVPFTSSTFVLLDCSLGGGVSFATRGNPPQLPPHLRLASADAFEQWQWDEEEAEAVVDDLVLLTDCISSSSPSDKPQVELLVLQPSFSTHYSTDDEIQRAVDTLLRVCEEHGVEVSIEKDQMDWYRGSMITEDLRERARSMRKGREEGKRR